MSATPVDAIVVAVPARDEVDVIAACIRSIDVAAQQAGVPAYVVVAADTCGDGTEAAASAVRTAHATTCIVAGSWRGAGGARAAAVDAGLRLSRAAPSSIWIANTDADTEVEPEWLVEQLHLARSNVAVAGVVDLDARRTSPLLMERFRASYLLDGSRHTHVHGANLGVRADAYLAVGGWCPHTSVGEDHGLWQRLGSLGLPMINSTRVRVVTSARVVSRVEGGFATNLRALVESDVYEVA